MWPSGYERLPHDREVVDLNPGRVIPKTLIWYLLPSCQALDIKSKEEGSKHGEQPVD